MIWKAIALALAGLLLAAIPAAAAPARVNVGDDYFRARVKTVAKGARVVWVNVGDERHSVTTPQRHVVLRPGQRFTRTVRKGFRYQCVYHSGMTGRIAIRR